jgi:nesprin-1
MDRMKKEYIDVTTTLFGFATEAHRKLSEPLEVSFINVKLLIQDLEVRAIWIKEMKHTL